MTCIINVVMLKLCVFFFKSQIVTPSESAKVEETINATVGGSVLFSVNCTPSLNLSIEWKKSGNSEHYIVMLPFGVREHTIFESYEGRVEFFENGSFALTNIQLNDTGLYTVTLIDNTTGKQVTIKKQLFVTARTNDPNDEQINNEENITSTEANKWWKFTAIIISASLLGTAVICVISICFMCRRMWRNTAAASSGVKRNENSSSNVPEIVYSTYVGAYANYGKSCQATSLDQT
ncbi:uncharacterized protein LOC132393443 [Hypanus sabinus]|uniref:uncharacterized protein LOC132393443 n=1 Tax=Hypanus sabinus TaxID=79690 RepID=UPI0028C4F3E8|nr:uncharacterized protein LOC132393443 [Hypanus sabinus]